MNIPEIFCSTCGTDVNEDAEGALNCRCIEEFGVYVVVPAWGAKPDALDILTLADFSSNVFTLDRNANALIRYRQGEILGFNLSGEQAS